MYYELIPHIIWWLLLAGMLTFGDKISGKLIDMGGTLDVDPEDIWEEEAELLPNRCVCCGDYVLEGRQICSICEKKLTEGE